MCEYCKKQIEVGKGKIIDIFKNGSRYSFVFCSKDCAAKYQMGAE